MSNVVYENVRGTTIVPVIDEHLKTGKIFLTGAVNADTCHELLENLLYLNSREDIDEIKFYINSHGGSVTDGLAVYDMIQLISVNKPVKTITCGIAASMGAILFLAGSERVMLENSKLMLHDPSFGSHDIAGRKPHEIQAELDDLKECQKVLANIISKRAGIPIKQVYIITEKDSYFTASEALSKGLCTKIVTEIKEVA